MKKICSWKNKKLLLNCKIIIDCKNKYNKRQWERFFAGITCWNHY